MNDLEKKLINKFSELMRRKDDENVSSLAEIRNSLSTILSQMEAVPKLNTAEECMLRRLYFSSMKSRFDSVSNAEMGTFSWLLEDEGHGDLKSPETNEEYSEDSSTAEAVPSTATRSSIKYSEERSLKEQVRQSFLEWLGSGDGIYHISGKAGSGKSTLVKFLCQNPSLMSELEGWAKDKKLVFANFFFWASGDMQQRSLEGLYRSLLFEILNQYPGLIEEVFPDQWAKVKSNPTRWEGMPFSLSELRHAMEMIGTNYSFLHHRFFFFHRWT